ncbi:AMP-binding protein [Campylobacter geochelonis]|uniref:AMP-binding protein n=1 Tax=Campylobacter geochelonis TaxID=1780362 RepID=UPI000770B0F6|nr:AMP-binding protein [Campylobacter geochelonis]CZE49345.1 3-phosphoshikimate 1-carboxyvinyltransferase [Campylobacter geochelonis]
MFDKNELKFDETTKEQILKFSAFLLENDIKEAQIYLSNTSDFIVAFFGGLCAKTTLYLLPNAKFFDDKFSINDANFSSIKAKNKSDKLNLNADEIFYLLTSGTSGKSKNIQKTLLQMVDEALYLRDKFGICKSDEFISSVSHQHMFGLTFKVFLPLVSGAKIIDGEYNYPEALLALNLKNHTLIASPTILDVLCQHANFEKMNGIKMIISAGASLKNQTRDVFKAKFGIDITEIYGSTETGVIACNKGFGLKKFESVALSVTQKGALVVSSPWCESFETSDSASIDGDDLTLYGRLDRIIKLSEKRVSLEEIELFLLKHDFVDDIYLGMHPEFSRVLALVKLSEVGEDEFRKGGKIAVVNELKRYLKSEYKNIVRYFKVVEKLEKNQNSKLTKAKFHEQFYARSEPKFSLIKSSDEVSVFRAKISVWDFYFDGHFGDFAIVPGFIQLGFALTCAKYLGLSPKNSFSNIKFTKLLRPNDTAELRLTIKNSRVSFEIYANLTLCASGRFDV